MFRICIICKATDAQFAKPQMHILQSNRGVQSSVETSCPPCSVAVALRAIGDASVFRDQLSAMLCSSGTKGTWRCKSIQVLCFRSLLLSHKTISRQQRSYVARSVAMQSECNLNNSERSVFCRSAKVPYKEKAHT